MNENNANPFSGFYKKSIEERKEIIKENTDLTDEDFDSLKPEHGLSLEIADKMIENVIGVMKIPFGVATNFVINKKKFLIPMVLEEPSVIAAASNAAKLTLPNGFTSETTEPIMIGQIQIVNVPNILEAEKKVLEEKDRLMEKCNKQDSLLIKFGGGAKNIETKIIDTESGKMLIVHLLVDVRDAMGANAVNTMTETIKEDLEEITKGKTRLGIISNFAKYRLGNAKAIWKKDVLSEKVIDRIIEAYLFAKNDIYRCATHNKGIMNGIDAVIIATGNDFRAIEAGAHSYASRNGKYEPLTKYYKNENGDLVGEIELPTAVGTVGGATRTHPTAKTAIKILGVKTAKELSEVIACVGLAQNFAAIRALADEGIQKGHMKLHSKNIAITGGAKGKFIEIVAEKLVSEKNISVSRAKELVENIQKEEAK